MSSNFNQSHSKQHIADEKTELQALPTSTPSVPSKTSAMPAMPAMPKTALPAMPKDSNPYVVPQETLTINPSRKYQEVSFTNEVAKSCTSCSIF